MNKKVQAGLLMILLVMPAFVFIFLHLFGENNYELAMIDPKQELQVYNPKVVNCEENVVEGVHRLPSFILTDQNDLPFSLGDLDGKIIVADFFFTRCPNICIEMTSQLLRVQERFKNQSDVHIVSHTVDPTHDSPEALRKYADLYAADTSKWTFLTGEAKDIYELARCGYFIVAKPNEELENDFIHSDKVVLIDKQRRIRGYYSGTNREDIDRLLTEISLLLQEENKKS